VTYNNAAYVYSYWLRSRSEDPSTVVADGPLTPFAEGVWVDTAPVRFLGMQLTATMTVLRLSDGNLLLYSPLALTPERRAAIEALGTSADRHNRGHYAAASMMRPHIFRGASHGKTAAPGADHSGQPLHLAVLSLGRRL
jgi:hypothetical protein